MSVYIQYGGLESAVNNLFNDNEIVLSEEKTKNIATKLEGDIHTIYPEFSEYVDENKNMDSKTPFRNFGLVSFDFNDNNLDEYFNNLKPNFFKKKERKGEDGKVPQFDNIIIFKIFDTVEADANFDKEDENNLRRKVKALLLQKNNEITLPQIILKRYTVLKDLEQPEFINIAVKDRVRSLEKRVDLEKDDEKNTHLIMNGYVFVAKLSDIVRGLYGKLGPRLFENNLRFSVDEQLKVESSIQDTIRKHPEYFWFYNNGISLYIPKEQQMLQRKSDEISVELSNEDPVSIINGAQTISTSSREILRHDCGDEVENAYVLLRVFTFGTETRMWEEFQKEKDNSKEWKKFVQTNVENVKEVKWSDLKRSDGETFSDQTMEIVEVKNKAEQMLNEITVSLNRQKPIRPEDIAYTTKFVTTINNTPVIMGKDFDFNFVRRGETDSLLEHSYQLISFARIAEAITAQNPGKARTSGGATLLKINAAALENDPMPMFSETDIFIAEDSLDQINGGDEEAEVIGRLKKSYKPINFSFELMQYLNKNNDEIRFKTLSNDFDEDVINSIYLYGVYHVLALTIYQLNNQNQYNDADYSTWTLTSVSDVQVEGSKEVISPEKLNDLIQKSVRLIYESISSDIEMKYDSNDFKNSDNYQRAKAIYIFEKLLDHPTLQMIADDHHKSVTQVIIRWALQRNIIANPKSPHLESTQQNADVDDFELTDSEVETINNLDENKASSWYNDYAWHNMQGEGIPDTVDTWYDSPEDYDK